MTNIKTTTTFAAVALFLALGAPAMAQNADDQTFDLQSLNQNIGSGDQPSDFDSSYDDHSMHTLPDGIADETDIPNFTSVVTS